MNTRKQVFLMSLLLMTMLVLVGIYGAWYPHREVDATEHFAEQTSERGAILFARNCRLCHGDVGEGGAFGARLTAAPSLDRADLQGFIDSKATTTASINSRGTELSVSDGALFETGQIISIDQEHLKITAINDNTLTVERGVEHSTAISHPEDSSILVFDEAALAESVTLLTNTIMCGRVGTAMPAWSQNHGGPLSDEQIRQLTVLITENRWDLVKEEVDFEDTIETELTQALDDSSTQMSVGDLSVFTEGEVIRLGEERLRITDIPTFDRNASDKSGTVTVERGVLGSVPLPHDVEEELFKFPEAPDPVTINAASCGQTAQAPAPAGTPELIEDFEGQTVEVIARGILFDTDEITVSLSESEEVRVRLDNQDEGVDHNIAFYESSTNTTAPLAPGSIGLRFPGPGIDDTVFTLPEAGTYFFRCDVHPTTMTGTFEVTE